uniref:Staygreen protein domain-containing protein n=1 Tax=Aegilops tauschii subsp. strangulata TaxID=200361 RepID=A0A453DM08_AEGTS
MTCTGGPGGGEMTLHLHCHVSGPNPLQELAAGFRYYVFSKELPLVLKAVVHGDAALFAARPELMDARVWVHFHSSSRKYNRIECWGALREATKVVLLLPPLLGVCWTGGSSTSSRARSPRDEGHGTYSTPSSRFCY